MKKEDYFNIPLPKWPECRVTGVPVTLAQAQEIIIRTDDLYFSSNDREFVKDLYRALGLKVKDAYPYHEWEDMNVIHEEYGILDIEYLQTARIVSSYIGGPHGWINWNGVIQQYGKNIGKWPSVERIYDEWVVIARAFPYLELTCQLFSGEGCEDSTKPVIEYRVKNGKVRMAIPKKPLFEGIQRNDNYLVDFFKPDREQGCTIVMFKEALETTKSRMLEPRSNKS
jgi:hypothetical protein